MAKLYRDKKEQFDKMVYGYLVKRLTEPLAETDAFGNGHIDEVGNELNGDEDWSYTKLDKLILDIRAALGDQLGTLVKDSYKDVDTMSLMGGEVDSAGYLEKYAPVVGLVEEALYLPECTRGMGGEIADDGEMTLQQRISFALTVATTLMVSLIKDRIINQIEFDNEVLPDTEATFGVRSIGSAQEMAQFLRNAKLSNGRDLTNQGIVLAARLAKVIIENGLCSKEKQLGNLAPQWEKLSYAQ